MTFFCFTFINQNRKIMNRLKIFSLLFFFAILPLIGQTKSVQGLIDEGIKLHDEEQYKKAISKFEQALKINPQSTKAMYEMALSYLSLEDYRNASKFSTQVINSNDKNLSVGAYTIKSESLAGMNKIDDAIKLLKEGIQKNGDNYLLSFNLALNFYKINNLDKTLQHVQRAIELDKSSSGAFLLDAYANKDKDFWVRSILSFQMFLLNEPDSKRSKNAFEEMLQTMLINPVSDKPVERSFVHQQLKRNVPDSLLTAHKIPSLTVNDGLNRNFVYHAITSTLDSLKTTNQKDDLFVAFKEVNKAIINVLDREYKQGNNGCFWNFYVPFFTRIVNSKHYDVYCRYISVSYFEESMKWWNDNKSKGEEFIRWFEKGE